MKQQEINLIDRKAMRQLRELHPNLSQLELVQILVRELDAALREQQQEERRQTPAEQELSSLARLRPTDEQLRRALLRLLAMRDGSDRPLLYKKTHWLAVCRALQHIGRITQEYGCWTMMENLIGRLLGQEARLYVLCDHNEMARKAAGKPYHQPLSRWHTCRDQSGVVRYLTIAMEFLRLIEAEGAQ